MFAGKKKLSVVAGAVLAAAVAVGAGIAIATEGDDDAPITGPALEKAVDAALQHTGGGTVTETEVGDDGAAYSVEVRLDDGREVEVNLDDGFNVIGDEPDEDGAGDEDGTGDD